MSKNRKLKLDVCRVHTDRMRSMSTHALNTALSRLYRGNSGPSHADAGFQAKLAAFARAIGNERDWIAIVAQTKPTAASAAHLKKVQAEARDREHEIWDLQTKAGCKIRPQEEVARDADRQYRHEDAARARAQRTLAKARSRRSQR